MKHVLAAAAVAAAMLAGSSIASQAAVIVPEGPVSLLTSNFDGLALLTGTANKVGGKTVSYTNIEYFNFTVPFDMTNTFTASVTTAPSSAVTIGAFNFYNSDGSLFGVAGTETNSKNWSIDETTFGTGNYFIGVTTTALVGTKTTSRGFTGNLAPTTPAVPLPSTVGLFGVAVAGLGVAGALRKRTKVVSA